MAFWSLWYSAAAINFPVPVKGSRGNKKPAERWLLSTEHHDGFLEGPPASGLLPISRSCWRADGKSPNPCTPLASTAIAPPVLEARRHHLQVGQMGFLSIEDKERPEFKEVCAQGAQTHSQRGLVWKLPSLLDKGQAAALPPPPNRNQL